MWDPITGALVGALFAGQTEAVLSVAFGTTIEGRLLLAAGGFGGTVQVWDPLIGAQVGVPLTEGGGRVLSLAFGTTREGRLLLASSQHRTVRIWDPMNGGQIAKLVLTGSVSTLATSPDNEGLLAIGGPSGLAVVSLSDL